MSLHFYVVPPPLALAVHPAPPLALPKKENKADKEGRDKKPIEGDKKGDQKDNRDANDDKKDKQGVKDDKAEQGDKPDKPAKYQADRAVKDDKAQEQDGPAADAPLSPASNIPEPPTPAVGATPDTPVETKEPSPVVPPPKADPKPSDSGGDDKPSKAKKAAEDPKVPPEPLQLLAPAPPRPLRARLDLNPVAPYPPINTDPRGAYYKYAKGAQAEWVLIDVTKDGWLAEQWREKSEREALAGLRGDTERQKEREIEKNRRMTELRKVPNTSEEVLLHLWNDLAEAPAYELSADAFWARFDWEDPEAGIYLKDIRRPEEKEGEEKRPAPEVEWTCGGLEEVLATVGVQCAYNTAKPLDRHWAEPAGAYLLMAHGFFLLRMDDYLQWKSEDAANQFEVLKTSGHDRVFGEMVKAQQAEERKKAEIAYKKRKLAEKKKAEEEAKKAEEEGKEVKGDDKLNKEEAEGKKPKPEEEKKDNEGLQNGEKVKAEKEVQEVVVAKVGEGAVAADKDQAIVALPIKDGDHKPTPDERHEEEVVAVAPADGGKLEVQVEDVKSGDKGENHPEAKAENKDNKDVEKKDDKDGHKKEGKEAKDAKGAKEIKDDKGAKADKNADKKHHHPHPPKAVDPDLLAKMIQAARDGDNIGMHDIELALKALEKAAESAKVAGMMDKVKGPSGPLIWTWQDSCEKWRWRNYQAGVHEVRIGGWEERDWKVFADGRGCDEFEREEAVMETEEEDVHDWSL